MKLEEYIRNKRKLHNLTQQELAERAGVGYRFIREMENGKTTVRMDKVNPNKLIDRLVKYQAKWTELIDNSFLSTPLKESYKQLIGERINRL